MFFRNVECWNARPLSWKFVIKCRQPPSKKKPKVFWVMSFQEKITGNSATFFSLSVLKKVWSLPITRENKRNCNGDCPWMTCICNCFRFVCCITQRSKLLSKVILVNFKPFAKHSTLSKDTTIKGQRFKVGHWPFATRWIQPWQTHVLSASESKLTKSWVLVD